MIKKLTIKNFKSILNLELDCKKINIFIGEPNTGKSNILEALGLLSWCAYKNSEINEYVRLQNTLNLFYDELFENSVEFLIENDQTKFDVKIKFDDDNFIFIGQEKKIDKGYYVLDYSGNVTNVLSDFPNFKFIKSYKFLRQTNFQDREANFLLPPHGSNMFAIVMGHKSFRESMAKYFREFGLNLVLKPQEKSFEVQKQVNDVVISYPYALISDTLQRIIFHVLAIDSNDNSTLIFEEPESHAFPYYTKFLGEKIAFDTSNQYFLATHNPYFLLSILEKADKNSVNVFITYFKDYQTKLQQLTNDQISELIDYDPFFNLQSFIDEE